jgi:hypothetical protein
MPNPYLDLPGLPFDTADDPRDQPRGITGREALINLLNHAESLSDEVFEFVSSCSRFPRLSPKQQQALVETWYQTELAIAFQEARRKRTQRKRRKSDGGERDR